MFFVASSNSKTDFCVEMFQAILTKFFQYIFILFLSIQSPWQHQAETSGYSHESPENILEENFSEEGIPNLEECQRSLIPVLDWLNETSSEHEKRRVDVPLSEFNNSINITDYNKNKSVEILTDYEEWFLKIAENASQYLRSCNHSLSAHGGHWKRMLEKYSMGGNLIPRVNHKRKLLNNLIADMEGRYSTSVVEKDGKTYRLDPELTNIMSDSRNFQTLVWAWKEWHNLASVNKANFSLMVDLMNEAATEHGFKDAGEVWRIYDLENPDADDVMKRLMNEMKPLYDQLHAYVRGQLVKMYASQVNGTAYENILDSRGPIPAHLLGNMWAQEWSSLEDVLIPYPNTPEASNVTKALLEQNYTVEKMFKIAEEFFVSLGFQPMTDVFWEKSVIRRPDDPNIEMVCHASAYDMTSKDDYRIIMCTEIDPIDFETIHHEMGHIVYFMEYRKQPPIFRGGGNPAFHEAIGDTIALSVMSPRHLEAIGLVGGSGKENHEDAEIDPFEELLNNFDLQEDDLSPDDDVCDDKCKTKINTLMRTALSKIAFLPFAFAVELWRYGVFRGDITPEEYNDRWWELREMYQGIVPPNKRDSDKFDPGAKYHIVANVPYARYFYSFIGQFQFHEALCKAAGFDGELFDCDIYGSEEAGQKLRAMLSEGSSRPWPELMRELTGTDTFNATSMMGYFKPLYEWLIEENRRKNYTIGW